MLDVESLAAEKMAYLEAVDDILENKRSKAAVYFALYSAQRKSWLAVSSLFADFAYPESVHAPLESKLYVHVSVPALDWVDGADGGESLRRIQTLIRENVAAVAEGFEQRVQEHVKMLEEIPREYMLATAGEE